MTLAVPTPVHVIGANGRTGAVLCRALLAAGTHVIPVVRNPERWIALGLPGTPRQAELSDPAALHHALQGAERIASVSFAVWTDHILQAAPPQARLVLIGTARRYGPRDDPPGADAAQAEALLLASARDAVMLHPTMIYGAPNDGTITRLAALIRRCPILPLPAGGRPLVQPIHVADLVAAIIAALNRPWPTPIALPIGGPDPLPTAALIRAIAHAAHLRRPLILPIPAALVRLLGRTRPAALRLLQDRTVDTTPMTTLLGITGRPLDQGLSEFFGLQ